ncbi:MAG: AAA domain-containing protein [Nitrospiraceae bacterium]
MTLRDLITQYTANLRTERDQASAKGLDTPTPISNGRLLWTIGTLQVYEFDLAPEALLADDIPVTIIFPDEEEPTEGMVLRRRGLRLLIQTFDAIGQKVPTATLVPDATGFLETVLARVTDMVIKEDAYTLGPTERLVPWLRPDHSGQTPLGTVSAVLTTMWEEERAARRLKLARAALELIRANKRLLMISPDHGSADEALGVIARTMHGAGLQHRSLLTRYELALEREAAGITLHELGFEAQMHQFYAKSRAEKAALRKKYDRFRELSPLLAHKAHKQRDLDEVKLLEWRLLTELSELQTKIKEIDATLSEYDNLPLWKRLGMQAAGRNTQSLVEYRTIYQQQVTGLKNELDMAKRRIEQLIPEATVPKDLRPEFEELKEEVRRLGGTKKIRELLAAEEGTNRQAFIQNRRLVATTAARVVADALFQRVRFDALLVDEAPLIPAPFLIAAAGLVREKIVLSGDPRDVSHPHAWNLSASLLVSSQHTQPSPALS